MASASRLGIGLGVGFGCFLLILGAEVYYLIWRKKRITDTSNDPTETEKASQNRSHYARQLLFRHIPTLFPYGRRGRVPLDAKDAQDIELGADKNCDSSAKQGGDDTEESVDSELMRLHNLSGPPRFLFTIKEETKEDLDSNDARSRKGSRARSLSDLVMSLDTPFLTPLASPPIKTKETTGTTLLILPDSYDNPLFESRPPPSPPPMFKFLRDAEEKLYKRIKEEAEAKLSATQKSIESYEEPHGAAAALTSSQVVPLEMEASSPPTAARPPPDNKFGCPLS